MKKKLFSSICKPPVLLGLFIVVLYAFAPQKYSLTGKWSILNPDGTPSGEYVNFKEDNSYNVALPDGQVGEEGSYALNDSLFMIKNIKNVCGRNYWGKYKLSFYGNDSVHFALIEDTCSERRMDMVGYNPGLKRYKLK